MNPLFVIFFHYNKTKDNALISPKHIIFVNMKKKVKKSDGTPVYAKLSHDKVEKKNPEIYFILIFPL